MKQKKLSIITIIIAVILSIALFLAGMQYWGSIFTSLLPIVGDVTYTSNSLTGQSMDLLKIGLILASIPIITILLWRFAPVVKTQRRVLVACIIVLAMIISVIGRREIIKSRARNLQPTEIIDFSDLANPTPKLIKTGIPVSSLKFDLFALIGLIGGSIISYFSLREKSSRHTSEQTTK
jgi:hypothetical protein